LRSQGLPATIGGLCFLCDHSEGKGSVDPLMRIDFATLVRSPRPNTFLLAPPGFCPATRIDAQSPLFGVSAARLREAFLQVALAKPRVSHVLKDDLALYDNFVARSALFGFPDLIAARFIDVDGGRSRLAVYSRSVFGHSDLGVNRKRVLSWMRELERTVPPV